MMVIDTMGDMAVKFMNIKWAANGWSSKSTEAKQLSRQGIEQNLPPKQTRRPLPWLLSPSFFYGHRVETGDTDPLRYVNGFFSDTFIKNIISKRNSCTKIQIRISKTIRHVCVYVDCRISRYKKNTKLMVKVTVPRDLYSPLFSLN